MLLSPSLSHPQRLFAFHPLRLLYSLSLATPSLALTCIGPRLFTVGTKTYLQGNHISTMGKASSPWSGPGRGAAASPSFDRTYASTTSRTAGARPCQQAKGAAAASKLDLLHHCSQNRPHGLPGRRNSHWLKSRSTRLFLACCMSSSLLLSLAPSSTFFAAAQIVRPLDPERTRLQGNFLHITDIHPDEFYINGGSIASACHRVTSDDDEDTVRGMRPGRRAGGSGGLFGAAYSICDAPFSLVNATFDWIDKNLIGKIDFVVWTGDNAR